MNLVLFKLTHIAGILVLFLGLGAISFLFATQAKVSARFRVLAFALHGLGLLLILISGFGMLGQAQLAETAPRAPDWAYWKIGIWVLLALGVSAAKRKPSWHLIWLICFVLLGSFAAYLGIFKP